MKISFCTSCAQRLYQLKECWYPNIEIVGNNPDVEWIIVNYDGDDEMHKFIVDRYDDWPKNFIYAKELSKHKWHMSIAKNISHQLGSGDMLFNLDCDNFIANSIEIVTESINDGVQIIDLGSGIPRDGTAGRIAITKELFYRMGGYDESFYPMAGQDVDLLFRAKAWKAKFKICRGCSEFAIKNDKVESVKLCRSYNMNWECFLNYNKKKILKNIVDNVLTVNSVKGMTKPNVEIFKK